MLEIAHYGVVALPCRVGDPDRKGKVEAGVGHATKTPLRGLRFESLDEAQVYLDRWDAHWADTRVSASDYRDGFSVQRSAGVVAATPVGTDHVHVAHGRELR